MLQTQRDERRDAAYVTYSDAGLACEAYKILDEVLQVHNMTPENFGIAAPSPDAMDPRRSFREYAAHLRDAAGMARERVACDNMTLSSEQQAVFDGVMCALEGQGPNVHYVDGPAGAGKTYLYTKLLRHVRADGGIALAMAMSGIAALLLEGGRTAHSTTVCVPLCHWMGLHAM